MNGNWRLAGRSPTMRLRGLLLCALFGCEGTIEAPLRKSDAPINPLECGPAQVMTSVPTRIRRLTQSEYAKTVAAVLGAAPAKAVPFPGDPVINGYSNDAESLRVTSQLAQNLWLDVP